MHPAGWNRLALGVSSLNRLLVVGCFSALVESVEQGPGYYRTNHIAHTQLPTVTDTHAHDVCSIHMLSPERFPATFPISKWPSE
ncbi:hypothetical protein B0J13DRAFT_228703 [Dactylonectria estremocensis]|uniref:Secreted protein n=1 Tax=Dactylonectria estremocensis TaxID=1079267 RepID=A0A9P9JCH2_9HYPO|nr:hypothetical protein B0J13DRAFT_228703 [Dactylonectria estremocensis]